MRPFAALETLSRPIHRTMLRPEGPRATPLPMGGIARVLAPMEGNRATALPMGGLVRKWHLTPWKRSSLLDVALSEDGTDATGTSWTDVINNLVTQAGTVFTARNLPAGSVAVVPRPQPGQVVPRPMEPTGFLGLTTNQLLIGAGVFLGGVLLMKMGRRK